MAVMCEGAWSITRLSNSRRVDDMHFSIQVATLRLDLNGSQARWYCVANL